MPALLVEAVTAKICGMCVVPVLDGEAQIDLPTIPLTSVHPPVNRAHHFIMAVTIRGLEDLKGLQHYVLWTPLFSEMSERIMALDLATMPESLIH